MLILFSCVFLWCSWIWNDKTPPITGAALQCSSYLQTCNCSQEQHNVDFTVVATVFGERAFSILRRPLRETRDTPIIPNSLLKKLSHFLPRFYQFVLSRNVFRCSKPLESFCLAFIPGCRLAGIPGCRLAGGIGIRCIWWRDALGSLEPFRPFIVHELDQWCIFKGLCEIGKVFSRIWGCPVWKLQLA